MRIPIWNGLRRRTKIVLLGASFAVALAVVLGFASGSAHVGLHGSFWISIVFTLWLESKLTR